MHIHNCANWQSCIWIKDSHYWRRSGKNWELCTLFISPIHQSARWKHYCNYTNGILYSEDISFIACCGFSMIRNTLSKFLGKNIELIYRFIDIIRHSFKKQTHDLIIFLNFTISLTVEHLHQFLFAL